MTANTTHRSRMTSPRSRRGLSIMEVLFSIGVLLIGILGLASVIPFGINQSSDAVNFDKSMAAVQNLVSETAARVESGTREGFVAPVTNSGTPKQAYVRIATTRQQLRAGVCVDPWFLAAAANRRPGGGADNWNGYNRAVFPCYDQAYNPLVAPSSDGVYNANGSANSGWFDDPTFSGTQVVGPRLARVAVAHDSFSYPLFGVPRQVPIAPTHSHHARDAIQASDPTLFLPDDDSRAPGRIFATAGGNLVRPFTEARLSAMSLVQSDPDDPSQVRINTVVMQRRVPVINPGAGDYVDTPTPAPGQARFDLRDYTFDADAAPYFTGEQLMYVSDVNSQASFSLGVGGTVDVVVHRFPTGPGVKPHEPPDFSRGQFILLMRNVYPPDQLATGLTRPKRVAFEWFKIREVLIAPGDNPAATVNDPVHGTNRTAWTARLELQGPAWIFDDNVRTTAGTIDFTTVPDNTFAVYMPEVVAVFDRTITVPLD